VIKSFRSQETEKVFTREGSRKLPTDIQQVALRKLRMLNNATNLKRSSCPAGKSTGEAFQGSGRPTWHSNQRAMANLLCVARGRCIRCRDHRLPL